MLNYIRGDGEAFWPWQLPAVLKKRTTTGCFFLKSLLFMQYCSWTFILGWMFDVEHSVWAECSIETVPLPPDVEGWGLNVWYQAFRTFSLGWMFDRTFSPDWMLYIIHSVRDQCSTSNIQAFCFSTLSPLANFHLLYGFLVRVTISSWDTCRSYIFIWFCGTVALVEIWQHYIATSNVRNFDFFFYWH